jgi:hypothetical protein
VLSSPALAFPPAKAVAHTGVYAMTLRAVRDGKAETFKHTVTIAVLGSMSSWKRDDGQITIYDAGKKRMSTYGGPIKDKVIMHNPMPAMANWELGYQALAADAKTPPKETGKGKYGGESCTVVQFDTRKLGAPELCVTDKGIVARYFLRESDGSETTFEAKTITIAAPPAKAFEIPADLKPLEN